METRSTTLTPEDAAELFATAPDYFWSKHFLRILASLFTTYATAKAKPDFGQKASLVSAGAAFAYSLTPVDYKAPLLAPTALQ